MPEPAVLSGYTPGAELSSTASATVHFTDGPASSRGSAQSKIENQKSKILKTYTTDSPPGPRRAALLLAFKSAVEAQMAAQAKAPACWAAVRATGEIPASPKNKNPRAAYLVTDYYPRTLARVVEARLTLDLRAIHALTAGIIEALATLDAAAARPHGALTPGNIFIAGSGPLRKSRIVLTEPAPLAGITPAAARAADNRALGTLIATLIRRRPHAGWPIEDGPEWTALGKHKNAWFDFCNYLLDPNPPADATTIDELRRRFARLGGRGMRTRTKIAIPLAAALALSSPFAALRLAPFEKIPESLQEFAIKLGNLPPDVEEVPPEFAALCDIWYEWFGALCAETAAPQNAPLWNADPWLRENILAHTTPEARAALDPRVLTEDDRNLENLRANPPATAKRGLVVRRTKQAHDTLVKLAESFVEWPGAQTLPQAAARLEKIGFTTAADELRAPDLAVLPSINSGRLPANITRRLRLLSVTTAAEHAWAAASRKFDILDTTADPVLRALRHREIQQLAPAPLADLPEKIASSSPALDARVALVENDWPSRIGHQRWLSESFVRAHTGPVTTAILARWDAEILDYYTVTRSEDPRQSATLDAAIAAATTALRNLTNEETNLSLGAEVSAPLASEKNTLDASLASLRAEQVLRKDIPAAREKTSALQTRYASLSQKIAAALDELHPDPAEWLARIRATTATASAVLNAEWARRRDALLVDITPERLASSETAFRDLRSRLRQIREFLAELDGPQLAGSVKPFKAEPGPEAALQTEAEAADAAQKETLLSDLLAQGQWNTDGTPAVKTDDFAKLPAVRERLDTLSAWREAAAKLVDDLARADTLMTHGIAWDESPLAPAQPPPWSAVAEGAPATGDTALSDAQITQTSPTPETLHAIYTRVAANIATPAITQTGRSAEIYGDARLLQTLQTETNRESLIRAASSGSRLSIPLTAWQRLDTLPDWPATLDELDREAALATALLSRIQNITTFEARNLGQTRESKIQNLKAAAPARWRRAYAQIPVEHTPEVIERMPAFGVTPDDLTGLDRFDYLLAQARQTRWARLTETEARDQRNTFTATARAIPEVAAHPGLERFLAGADAINLEPTGEETTPADIGPGRIGWTGEFSDDMRTATYRWTDPGGAEHTQTYRLLEPDSAVPFFLRTTAVSVGEFISLIESRSEGRDVIAAMPSWIADVSAGTDTDFRAGPQTWRVLAPRRATATRINDSRMTVNTRWQAFSDPRWPEPYYAPGITEPQPPAADSPMQNIPPAAARLFAEKILGARLATPDEWAGIVELYASRFAGPEAPGANFSDATWLAQRDYLVQNGALFEHPWPDSGAYAPPGQPLPTAQTHATAPAYAPQKNDSTLWFAGVASSTAPDGFSHLFGNVATYLYDPHAPAVTRYSVAGGSAISPATIDPREAYPVTPDSEGYADIGLRPAFDASKAMILRGQLMMLLRKQNYVRQQTP